MKIGYKGVNAGSKGNGGNKGKALVRHVHLVIITGTE